MDDDESESRQKPRRPRPPPRDSEYKDRDNAANAKKLSSFIQAMDKEHSAKVWEACKDGNRSGTLHFGKGVTFIYPTDSAEQKKLYKNPELIDSLIITRHMYWSNKGENWRCWLNFAKEKDSHTTTDSHILIETDKVISSSELKLKGGQTIKMSKEWDYGNKFQVGYTFSGPIPSGEKIYIEGAMEKTKLENWENDADYIKEYSNTKNYSTNGNVDPRLRIEKMARTSVLYDLKNKDSNTPSAYCQYVTSFLGSLEKGGTMQKRAQAMMSPSAMVSFYIIFLTSWGDIKEAVLAWSTKIKLLDCCDTKDSCLAEFKKHYEEGQQQNQRSASEYIVALSSIKVGSSQDSSYKALEVLYKKGTSSEKEIGKLIWRDLIRLKLVQFLMALKKQYNIHKNDADPYDYSDILSTNAEHGSLLNDIIVNGICWDHEEFDIKDIERRSIIELIRTLPSEFPMPETLVKIVKDEKNKPSDPYLSPIDITSVQNEMMQLFSF